ncbi:solute carrier family 23 protein, partial [Klebsiella pneumoniae]
GGATLVMFGTVAAAGIRILAQAPLDRRSLLIMATSFGIGLGVSSQPDLLSQMPRLVQNVFGSAITSGGEPISARAAATRCCWPMLRA